MAASDQTPGSVGVRNVSGGRHAGGAFLGSDEAVADFLQSIQGYKGNVIFDITSKGIINFIGTGVPGAKTSEALWQIQKFFYDSKDNLLEIRIPEKSGTPNGGFVHIWNDRNSLVYPDPAA
jgi:hypothetical protein